MACDHVTSCNFHRKTKLAENWPNWLREKCYSIDDAKSLVREILQIIQLSAKVAISVVTTFLVFCKKLDHVGGFVAIEDATFLH